MGPIKMKKEYGFPFWKPRVKAKKNQLMAFQRKRTFQLEQNYRLNLLFSEEKNLFFHIGFGSKSQEKEPLTLAIKVIFQAFNLQKIL